MTSAQNSPTGRRFHGRTFSEHALINVLLNMQLSKIAYPLELWMKKAAVSRQAKSTSDVTCYVRAISPKLINTCPLFYRKRNKSQAPIWDINTFLSDIVFHTTEKRSRIQFKVLILLFYNLPNSRNLLAFYEY